MTSYVIDDLDPKTLEKLEQILLEQGFSSSIERLFWLPLRQDQLSSLQQEHASSCGPYAVALEVLDSGLRLEFLVRARNSLHCQCIAELHSSYKLEMMTKLDLWVAECIPS